MYLTGSEWPVASYLDHVGRKCFFACMAWVSLVPRLSRAWYKVKLPNVNWKNPVYPVYNSYGERVNKSMEKLGSSWESNPGTPKHLRSDALYWVPLDPGQRNVLISV